LIEDKKLQNAKKDYIDDRYLFQQFQSGRCYCTVTQAKKE
jgi:hypothetical protein